MAVLISDVKSELQLYDGFISDSDITYVITKSPVDDLNLVCAGVLQLVLRKFRGRKSLRIGKFAEVYDYKELRSMIQSYRNKSVNYNPGNEIDFSDDIFTRDGI